VVGRGHPHLTLNGSNSLLVPIGFLHFRHRFGALVILATWTDLNIGPWSTTADVRFEVQVPGRVASAAAAGDVSEVEHAPTPGIASASEVCANALTPNRSDLGALKHAPTILPSGVRTLAL